MIRNRSTPRAAAAGRMMVAALAMSIPALVSAQAQVQAAGKEGTSFDAAASTYRLWPGRAPGATGDDSAQTPMLTVVRPSDRWNNGSAVVILPGGGYASLSMQLEGAQPASWFAARGVTAFVVTYRVGPTMLPLPLLDGGRAVRFVRAHAAQFGIDPKRIGLMGFSAGGHLAAMQASRSTAGNARSADPVERVGDRPDFLILAYPWLEATVVGKGGVSPYCDFARRYSHTSCVEAQYTQFLPAKLVRRDAPPTFIYHTTADGLVPAEGSARYYVALREAGVPAELHLFADGEHGSGMGGSHPALSHWPLLLQEWLRGRGMLPPPGKGDAYP